MAKISILLNHEISLASVLFTFSYPFKINKGGKGLTVQREVEVNPNTQRNLGTTTKKKKRLVALLPPELLKKRELIKVVVILI